MSEQTKTNRQERIDNISKPIGWLHMCRRLNNFTMQPGSIKSCNQLSFWTKIPVCQEISLVERQLIRRSWNEGKGRTYFIPFTLFIGKLPWLLSLLPTPSGCHCVLQSNRPVLNMSCMRTANIRKNPVQRKGRAGAILYNIYIYTKEVDLILLLTERRELKAITCRHWNE